MMIVIGLLIGYAISFLMNAGLVWLLCWGLKAVGITTICGWTVAFSWPLVLIFTVVYIILHGIFGNHSKK
jgi:hypothetical protein